MVIAKTSMNTIQHTPKGSVFRKCFSNPTFRTQDSMI
uniref:Uncharacterized protein n=1 Tax=Arundo donax TaxID=35708 RepID=A0A0A9BIY7_ARUDO